MELELGPIPFGGLHGIFTSSFVLRGLNLRVSLVVVP